MSYRPTTTIFSRLGHESRILKCKVKVEEKVQSKKKNQTKNGEMKTKRGKEDQLKIKREKRRRI